MQLCEPKSMMDALPLRAENKPRICLVLVYLGPWPPYWDLFLYSIRFNPDVDWLIVCDQPLPESALPPNVRVIVTTKPELVQRIADAIGTPVNLAVPYKLCDCKCAYGVIFEEELRGYDVWGHCDSDIVFGQIRRFVTNEVLASYDKVLMHAYMAFYRNSPIANNFFRLTTPSIDYRDVFVDPRYCGLDEWPGMARILKHHNIPYFQQEFMATPNPTRYDLRAIAVKNYYPQAFVWDEGRVLQLHWDGAQVVETEFALIHLMRRKMKGPDFPVNSSLRRFAITPDGFAHLTKLPSTPDELMKLNPRRAWYPAYVTMLRPLRRLRKFFRERELVKRFPPHAATKPSKVAK
ncbi:MAG TPA: DUF6625 family protein [Lacipirellulaceae bacterium]|nr:DUF6625 family protein [Lacipirellulaceae bacterium]